MSAKPHFVLIPLVGSEIISYSEIFSFFEISYPTNNSGCFFANESSQIAQLVFSNFLFILDEVIWSLFSQGFQITDLSWFLNHRVSGWTIWGIWGCHKKDNFGKWCLNEFDGTTKSPLQIGHDITLLL